MRISDWSSDVCSSDLSALDGDTAMGRLLSEPPDVLVLDIMLPPHSCFEVLKRVRREPGLRDLPVLVLTARGQERDRHTALRLGADAFVKDRKTVVRGTRL